MWILLFAAALSLAGPLSANDCEGLAKLTIPHTTISSAELRTSGTFTPPEGAALQNLPPFCRVAATIKPTSDSNIRIELWLPQTGWNGRLQGTGNGGFAGKLSYGALAGALRRAYATANTDMGTATPPSQDASIFTSRPEVWADWGYRATHEMTVISKQLIRAYYGKPAQRAYFVGCSTGGEQALMEAQRFAGDYDGIVAGAPANNRTGVHMSILWNYAVTQKAPIPKAKLFTLNQAAVKACDLLDGVADGIIADPSKCRFDPAILQCPGADSDSCLTAPQVETARQLYAGPINPYTRETLYPGLTPGSEFGWDQLAPKDEPPFAPIFKWVFGLDWKWRSFDFDRAFNRYQQALAPVLNATNPDLEKFRSQGGKLIAYHGWADWLVPPGESITYFKQVRAANRNTDTFYRLFMVPGMAHCGGGPGENQIDPLTAVVDWVEQGTAPANLTASRSGSEPSQRLLCPFPQTAKYSGTGGIHDPTSYFCAAN